MKIRLARLLFGGLIVTILAVFAVASSCLQQPTDSADRTQAADTAQGQSFNQDPD